MARIIEITEEKKNHIAECTEKILHYAGKLMQCIENVDSKYNEYEGRPRKRHNNEPWEEDNDRYMPRYY